MSSKRRLRRRSCTGKVLHRDPQTASEHAYAMRTKRRGGWIAYKCAFGDHWHVGRRPR